MKPIQTDFWKINLLLALSYFVLGVVCSRISGNELLVPVLFLPEGVSLAAALVFGWRCAFGVFVGQLALALFNQVALPGALSVATINSLEVVLASYLARRWAIGLEMLRFSDYAKLALLIIGVLQPYSALASNLLLWLLGIVPNAEAYWNTVAIWWSSNALGQLLLTPVLLSLLLGQGLIKNASKEDLIAVIVLPFITLAVFLINKSDLALVIALLLPMVLLGAYRNSLGLFSLSAAISALLASVATSYGIGPFVHYAPNSYTHLNVLFYGTFIPAQLICLLFKELKLEQSQVLSLSEERIRFLTYFDSLTGLPNHKLAESLLLPAMEASGLTQRDCAVVLIDVDDFKQVNEQHGQKVGDAVLKQIAEKIKSALRPNDHLCRIGGDEFLAILPNLDSRSTLNGLVEGIMTAISVPSIENNQEIELMASCGIATIRPKEHVAPDVVIRNAESALFAAKRDGVNRYLHYTPQIQEAATQFSSLTEGLRFALERQELLIHYQPQVDLMTGQIVGAEALLRWQVPGLGVLSPASFIAIAERSGAIISIGAWVIRSVCQQIAQWQAMGLPRLSISLNISSVQVHRSDVGQLLEQALADTGIDPSLISLELTESTLLQQDQAVSRFIQQLEAIGANLAIDDFGTGFSNLSYIRRLKVARLKIDKIFVQGMVQSETDQTIVKSVIDLARGLGAIAVAEGVEDEATANTLKALGCQQAQGYYFAQPISVQEFEQRVRAGIDGSTGVVANTQADVESEIQTETKSRPVPSLPESEDQYRLLYEHAPIGIALVDHATGAFKEVNDTLLKWTGYSKDEFLKLSFWDITPRSYEAQELAQITQLNQTGCFGPSFKEYIRKDGSRFAIKISGFKVINRHGVPMVWGLIDKLDATTSGANASPSIAGLDHLNILFDAICMVDETGSFVFVSQAAERIFGYKPEEMIGKAMIDFVYEADREQTLSVASRVMKGDFVSHYENRYMRKDGQVVDILWSARWSEPDRFRIAVARDITERKRNEKRLLAMYNISESANKALNLSSFLRKLNKILVDKLGDVELMVVLYDPHLNRLSIPESIDTLLEDSAVVKHVPEQLCMEVIHSGNMVRIEGETLKTHPDYAAVAAGCEPDLWIGLPLNEGGQCHGVFSLTRLRGTLGAHVIDEEFMTYVSNQITLVIDRLSLQDALRQKAMYDALTRLPNRTLFNDRLTASMSRVKRDGKKLVLMYLDLNDFKRVNDSYGHLLGDLLLQAVGERLSKSIRASDTVARIGGDEFVCLLEGDLTDDDLAKLTAKIRSNVDGPVVINGWTLDISVSLGIAVYPDDGDSIDALMSVADKAMYADKLSIKTNHARKNSTA